MFNVLVLMVSVLCLHYADCIMTVGGCTWVHEWIDGKMWRCNISVLICVPMDLAVVEPFGIELWLSATPLPISI